MKFLMLLQSEPLQWNQNKQITFIIAQSPPTLTCFKASSDAYYEEGLEADLTYSLITLIPFTKQSDLQARCPVKGLDTLQ